MRPDQLLQLFELNDALLRLNLEGMTHEASILPPMPAGNSYSWVFGHIVYWRNELLGILNAEQLWTDGGRDEYRGLDGKGPKWSADHAIPFEELVNEYEISQRRLAGALEIMSTDDLSTPFEKGTLGEKLAQLQCHEAYHVGQLGVLRRFVGLDGAVPPRGRRER